MKFIDAFLLIMFFIVIAVASIFEAKSNTPIAENKVTINYIYALSDNEVKPDYFFELVKEYESKNPNVKINLIFAGSPIEAIIKTVSTQNNNNNIDFAILNDSELYTLINQDLIVPLDNMIMEKYGLKLLEEYKPVFLENSIYNGYIWSIPFKRDVMLMYSNTAHLKQSGILNGIPPQNWDQLFKYSEELTVRDKNKILRYGVAIPLNNNILFESIAAQLDKYNYPAQYNKGTNYNIYNERASNAAKILQKIAQLNVYSKTDIFDVQSVCEMFLTQKASIMFAPSSLENKLRHEASFDFTVSQLPEAVRATTVTSGMNIYIMSGKSDEKYKQTYDFISWLMKPEIYQRWVNRTGFLPLTEYIQSTQNNYTNTDEIVSQTCVFENSNISKKVNDAILNVVYNGKDIDSEFTNTEVDIKKILLHYIR